MCKGCAMTRRIEKLYQKHGLINGQGPGGLSMAVDDFDAAINAPINILSHIAATWFAQNDKEGRDAFLRDVVGSLVSQTERRLSMATPSRGVSTTH